jgi:hypothetical protein
LLISGNLRQLAGRVLSYKLNNLIYPGFRSPFCDWWKSESVAHPPARRMMSKRSPEFGLSREQFNAPDWVHLGAITPKQDTLFALIAAQRAFDCRFVS